VTEYANPRALVETEWVSQHLNDPRVKIVEVDVETEAYYEDGHIPGALCWNWQTDLQDPVRRDILNKEQMEALLSRSGNPQRRYDRALWRQQQLVRGLRLLAAEAVRP